MVLKGHYGVRYELVEGRMDQFFSVSSYLWC